MSLSHIMGPFPPSFLVSALERAAREEDVHNGLRALVVAYYHEYTDATTLEPVFIQALIRIVELLEMYDEDLRRAVRAAERAINDNGGIHGTEGWHPVGPTFEDDEDDD
jgi:hypothetical protein